MHLLEPLTDLLAPYKDVVGAACGLLTILQFFSGSLVCNDIRKKGSAAGFPLIPLLGLVVLCGISIPFGFQIRDDMTIKVNMIGFALGTIYCLIYYYYTPNEHKTKVWGQFGLGGAFTTAIIAYSQLEDPKVVEFRFGMIVTVLLLTMIASPLFDLPEIMRKKSTAGMPFPIIFSGTLCGLSWLAYGVCLNNDFMIIQNVVAVALSFIQLSLFVIYPSTPPAKETKKSAKKTN
ncbi:sugar transporter SWEET1 [Culicoides brevitarsis]|uniref:sugar transporter SWEET1 n=1 Tax=Culicoides brevitarsis TaxID=469753 RepID=UPI00307C7601